MPHLQYILRHCEFPIIFLLLQKDQIILAVLEFSLCASCVLQNSFLWLGVLVALETTVKGIPINEHLLPSVQAAECYGSSSREILLLLSSEIQSLIK